MNEAGRSQAYVATLPRDHKREALKKLMAWGADNCWKSRVVERSCRVSWVAIREKTRTEEQWTRHVRDVFETLGVGSED